MTQLWLITLPDSSDPAKSLQEIKDHLFDSQGPLGRVLPFDIPALTVGSLDSLMALSDDLVKINTQIEGVLRKIERQYYDIAGSGADKLRMNNDVTVGAYLKQFSWDSARYTIGRVSMVATVSQIQDMVAGVDDELKKLSVSYSEKNQMLSTIQRKKNVNLASSDFEDYLTPQQAAAITSKDSDFCVTVMAVVPLAIEEEFKRTYFTLGPEVASVGGPDWSMNSGGVGRDDGKFGPLSGRNNEKGSPVIPESISKIISEGDYSLYSMSILRGHYEAGVFDAQREFTPGKLVEYLDPFILAAREKRVIIRPWKFDNSKAGGIDGQIDAASASLKKMQIQLTTWCRTHFGEVYAGWIHLKVIRAFAESVLRYGVPADKPPKYLSMFVQPNMKKEKASLDALSMNIIRVFPELGGQQVDADEEEDSEYLPYVCQKFTVIGANSAH